MSVRHLHADLTAALLGGFGPVTPAAAYVLAQPDPASAYILTAGRLWSLVAVLLGLAGVVIGGLVLARSAGRIGTGTGRWGAIVALAAGLLGAAIGGLVVAAAEGGPGTGYGIVGGFVGLAVGLIAMGLGGLALTRSRRTARPADRGECERPLGSACRPPHPVPGRLARPPASRPVVPIPPHSPDRPRPARIRSPLGDNVTRSALDGCVEIGDEHRSRSLP